MLSRDPSGSEKKFGPYRNINAIDLTNLDGDFVIEPISLDSVQVLVTGKPSDLDRVNVREGRRELFVTDRTFLSAPGEFANSDPSIPLPRRRGRNVVVYKDGARRPNRVTVKNTPLKRTGNPGIMVRIGMPRGAVVTY